MFTYLIRFFWLLLFALALPAQAMACLSEPNTAASLKQIVAAPPTALKQNVRDEQPSAHNQPSLPETQTGYAGSNVAILHSLRWSAPARFNAQGDDPNVADTTTLLFPQTGISLALRDLSHSRHLPYLNFHTSYRLSGWKETNAMYVALNRQYFS
ncbi:hypothetical protein KDD30_21425 (plasmid) [Photobacterium sp. GJ3]|uniref:hypothetical protein n=1 Tax=Photobacterium sp. GJ3 TaxID=2829502 RepID=UPI001B8AC516|nr:hypothetical protein [Photobacterium sp. GJ3]QUJ69333.1 hypothetical protein KDD30_21425 [Photobacterium sp. GJ3]